MQNVMPFSRARKLLGKKLVADNRKCRASVRGNGGLMVMMVGVGGDGDGDGDGGGGGGGS